MLTRAIQTLIPLSVWPLLFSLLCSTSVSRPPCTTPGECPNTLWLDDSPLSCGSGGGNKKFKWLELVKIAHRFCYSQGVRPPPGQISQLSTYVWFLQCALCETVNSTRCCCDWTTSELPPMRGKGRDCRALAPAKATKKRLSGQNRKKSMA